jgi:hypothetical protein
VTFTGFSDPEFGLGDFGSHPRVQVSPSMPKANGFLNM